MQVCGRVVCVHVCGDCGAPGGYKDLRFNSQLVLSKVILFCNNKVASIKFSNFVSYISVL